MKRVLFLIFALATSAYDPDVDNAKEVLECFRQALDGGIESINLTNFNPLTPDDQLLVLNNKLIRGTINFTHIEVDGLIDFNVTELVADRDPEIDHLNYDYNLTWPEVRVTCNYSHNVSVLGLPYVTATAFVNITWYQSHVSGIFNVSTGDIVRLDDFYFDSTVEDIVDSSIIYEEKYAGPQDQQILGYNMLYRSELADILSPIIKEYLNDNWIVGGLDRLIVVAKSCKL